jgi:hypothetical protein
MLKATAKVLSALAESGLLLKQDKRLPNVVTILTGDSLSMSWWSHPKSRLIFRVLSELGDHPDVLFTKLLLGKDTLVHRSVWPAFLAVVTAAAPWQVNRLSPAARTLLESVSEPRATVRANGPPVRELVSKLLVRSFEVHTEAGRHAIALESWPTWAARVKAAAPISVTDAREALESACLALGAPLSALPWGPARHETTKQSTER